MTDAAGLPGPLIGSGRAADVYALDGGQVLRRYRTAHSCAVEADLMRYLREAGYPVPAVFAVDGADLVMQRLYGRDMLADLGSRPWRVARHARTLARLHDRLHQIAAPAGLRQFGSGGQVLHLDLHPGNVMLTADGPFVIDWSNGCAGEAGADVAMAYLIMASSDVDGLPWWLTPVARGLVRVFLSRFRAAVRDDPRPHLARVARFRLEDPNVRPAEAARLRRRAARRRQRPLADLTPPFAVRTGGVPTAGVCELGEAREGHQNRPPRIPPHWHPPPRGMARASPSIRWSGGRPGRRGR